MSERGPSFDNESSQRDRVIAAVGGIILFNFERGPNAHTPDRYEETPEVVPETGVEPTQALTDDEATYIVDTLSPAASEITIEQ